MKWAAKQRQRFVGEALSNKGFVRRSDLMHAFEVSSGTAWADIKAYAAAHPGSLRYDTGEQAWVVVKETSNV